MSSCKGIADLAGRLWAAAVRTLTCSALEPTAVFKPAALQARTSSTAPAQVGTTGSGSSRMVPALDGCTSTGLPSSTSQPQSPRHGQRVSF
jgi:hypothetical protein